MNNLKIQNYQPAPIASTMQKGGRRCSNRKGCKCSLCKKKGGVDPDKEEISDTKVDLMEKNVGQREIFDETVDNLESGNNVNGVVEVADEIDYNALEEGTLASGGSRKRKYRKKTKKNGRSRKTRRRIRKIKRCTCKRQRRPK